MIQISFFDFWYFGILIHHGPMVGGRAMVETYSDNKLYDKDQRKDIFYYCFYTNPRNCWQISRIVDWQIFAQQGWHRPRPRQPTSKLNNQNSEKVNLNISNFRQFWITKPLCRNLISFSWIVFFRFWLKNPNLFWKG